MAGFRLSLSNQNQFVSINGFDYGPASINCGIPRGFSPGPVLFLLYTNDLNQAIEFCKVCLFTDDSNLSCLTNCIKKPNKLVNADLEHLVSWLNANKISLNVKKTEIVLFKFKQKELEDDLKIRLCCKKLYLTESVKYLGVRIDVSLS